MYKYTVYLVISKLKIPYVHRIYMVLANPRYIRCTHGIFGREITIHTVIYGADIYGSGQLNKWCRHDTGIAQEQLC